MQAWCAEEISLKNITNRTVQELLTDRVQLKEKTALSSFIVDVLIPASALSSMEVLDI